VGRDSGDDPPHHGVAGLETRQAVAAAAFLLSILLLVGAVVRGAPLTWRTMRAETAAYAPLSREERDFVFITRLEMPAGLFQWYREQLRRGDGYYVHGAPGGFGQFADLRTTVRALGRLHFLPAVEVDRPEDANVIVSWGADPAELGFRYVKQVQAGEQPYFVSRVDLGR
jgi:hypothetical protein